MQDSHITYLKKVTGNRIISLGVKSILLLGLLSYIAVELFQTQGLANQFKAIGVTLIAHGWSSIYILLLLLVPINWLLEAWKWQLLIKPITHINLGAAVKGVLTGLSLGFMTPHSLGDYLGRIAQVNHTKRMESLGAVLLGRGAQFITTLLFGLWGLWQWYLVDATGWAFWFFWGTLGAFTGLLSAFLFARSSFVRLCEILWPSASKFVKILSRYDASEVVAIFGLSIFRYMTFATQFFLLLFWLEVPLTAAILWAGVTWVFLAKSVIPAFNFLSDLGVREFSALYFFGLFAVAPAPILTASLSVWFLNIMMPTLIGSLFITQMKLLKN